MMTIYAVAKCFADSLYLLYFELERRPTYMLNLRVVRKNNDWNKIIELTKATFKAVA